jgi:cytidylate kinase
MRKSPVVAIDGPSGAGKSTVARGVAKALNFAFIDTGALYRAVAWLANAKEMDWEDGPVLGQLARAHDFKFNSLGELFVDGDGVGTRIRTPEMSLGASRVAQHPEVRQALSDVQRRLSESGGVVLEGRDIGTVVFPNAEMKFFLTAGTRVRAQRRFDELLALGEDVTLADVERDQEQRDEQDRNRAVSPLKQAEDAEVINCDNLDADEVIERMVSEISAKFPLTSN